MKKFFKGKNVYITGGSSGLGFACAKLCAEYGSNVLIIARDEKKLETACGEIIAQRLFPSQRVSWASLDVADADEVKRRVQEIVTRHGVPDVLIASAGASYADYFENIIPEKFDEIMKVNVYGIRNTVFALLPYMKNKGTSKNHYKDVPLWARYIGKNRFLLILILRMKAVFRGAHKSPRISIVSSLAGLVGVFGYTAYGTSKFAAVGLAECLRVELKRYCIAVSVVCPPEVDTPLLRKELEKAPTESRAMKKFAGFLKPEQAARSILRGIARKKFLIIPGFRARMTYFFHRHSGGTITRFVSDMLVKRTAQK